MRILGFEVSINRNELVIARKSTYPADATLVGDRGRWWLPVVREPYTGAWQKNDELRGESILAMYAVYACIERIASDVGKCRIKLVEQDEDDIWNEVESAAFSPVLRKPNYYQTRIQFFENWVISKLVSGNTYVLKQRDNRGVVIALYVLDPMLVRVLVTPDGDVYYKLDRDNLAALYELYPNLDRNEDIVVPASEIIHDMMTIKWHPLCGVSPLVAAAGPAAQSTYINRSSQTFFRNKCTPGGVLTAPGEIKEATAKRLKEYWQTEFAGDNSGKVAVLGDGLKFEPMAVTASDAQLVEQYGLTAKMVCSAFGVPAYMVGVGDPPAYNNIEALNTQYYTQCLQKYFEAIELLLDEGLGLVAVKDRTLGTEFDLDDLLRMDTKTLVEVLGDGVKAGLMKPNEGRKRLNYTPVEGGDSCYLQQQNFSLEALAKRDAKDDPFAKGGNGGGGAPFGAPALPAPADEEAASMADIENWRHGLRLRIESRAAA